MIFCEVVILRLQSDDGAEAAGMCLIVIDQQERHVLNDHFRPEAAISDL